MSRFVCVAAGVAALATLLGCQEKAKAPPPPPRPPHVVPVGARGPHLVRRELPVKAKVLKIEPRHPEQRGADASVPSKGHAEPPVDVKVMGAVHARGIKAQQVVVWVGGEDCTKVPEHASPFGRALVPFADPARFAVQVAAPQRSTGFVCAAALDGSNRVVAEGAWEKNPIKMSGTGEITYGRVELSLQPNKSPRPVARGLLP